MTEQQGTLATDAEPARSSSRFLGVINPRAQGVTDLLRKPASAFFWWCLPLIIGFGSSLSGLRPSYLAAVWSVSLAWMGTGCIVNLIRCRRVHCYISGPAFVLAAFAEALVASGAIALGTHAASGIANVALMLALLSFLPEMVWGRYPSGRPN